VASLWQVGIEREERERERDRRGKRKSWRREWEDGIVPCLWDKHSRLHKISFLKHYVHKFQLSNPLLSTFSCALHDMSDEAVQMA